MTGKKRMRRLALTGALLMLCTNTAAGCRQQEKQEVTPEVLMDAVDEKYERSQFGIQFTGNRGGVGGCAGSYQNPNGYGHGEHGKAPEQDTQRGGRK